MENRVELFREEMLDEIRNEAKINYSDPTSEFLAYYTNLMIESEEILEFEEYDIEVIGNNRRKARVDGYCYDRLDRSISLFIADFSNNDNLENLINSTIDTCVTRVKNYLDFVYNGYITQNCEESSSIVQLASEILEKDSFTNKIKIYILSDSALSKMVKNISSDDYLGKKTEIVVWDINRIYNLVKSSMRREDLTINLEEYDGQINCIKAVEDKNGKYTSYLGIINGDVLANLYIEYGSRLLEGNVRSFLSVRGKINKGIRRTISNEPDIFFVYNNGIACTATDVKMIETNKGLVLKEITNLQIINGGQTTASIANAILQDHRDKEVANILVPMKLTVLNKEAFKTFDNDNVLMSDMTVEERADYFVNELTSNIARYANSQNKVDESDFFSNHPYHVRFEELSRKVYAPPIAGSPIETIWFYERAKGQYIQEQMKLTKTEKKRFLVKYPKNQVIKKIDLAKYIMTYYMHPDIVSKGNQYNMRIFANVIEQEWKKDKDKSSFNNYYYKKCISLAIIFKRLEKIVSQSEWYKAIKAYRANIVTYTISSMFYVIQENYSGQELNFLRIWNSQGLYKELENQLETLSYEIFKFITREDRATLNVTEWCKKEACWTRAKKMIDDNVWQLNSDFVTTLIEKSFNMDQMKNEKNEQKLTDGINVQTKVIEFGDDYWKKALKWGVDMRILNDTEISFLKSASNFSKRIPSEKQCKTILNIHEKLIDEGFK